MASVLTGKCGLAFSVTPHFAAQRRMSPRIHAPFAGTAAGERLPVALKTPPSSMGRNVNSAPARRAIPGSCVQAR